MKTTIYIDREDKEVEVVQTCGFNNLRSTRKTYNLNSRYYTIEETIEKVISYYDKVESKIVNI